MIGIRCTVILCRGTLCIFRSNLTGRIFLSYFGDTFVHFISFFLITLIRVERHYFYHRCTGVFRSEFPADLKDGTMYLDAQKVLRFAYYAQSGFESDHAIDVWHGCFAHISIAFPCSGALPCEIVSGLAILHDGWNTVVVVCGYGIVFCCISFGLFQFSLFLLNLGQVFFKLCYFGIICFNQFYVVRP